MSSWLTRAFGRITVPRASLGLVVAALAITGVSAQAGADDGQSQVLSGSPSSSGSSVDSPTDAGTAPSSPDPTPPTGDENAGETSGTSGGDGGSDNSSGGGVINGGTDGSGGPSDPTPAPAPEVKQVEQAPVKSLSGPAKRPPAVTPLALSGIDLSAAATFDLASLPVGGMATLTVTIRNLGLAQTSGASVRIAFPRSLSFASDAGVPSGFDPFTGIWTVGQMDPGAEVTLSIPVRAMGVGTDSVSVQVDPASGTDANPANNHATAPLSVLATADVSVYSYFDTANAEVGDTVSSSVVVLNRGPDEQQNASISVVVPAGLKLVAAVPSSGSWDAAAGKWLIPTLRDGRSANLAVSSVVTAPGDSVQSAAIVGSKRIDPDPSGDSSVAVVHGLSSDFSVSQSLTSTPMHPGDTVTLHQTVTNQGPDAAGPTGVQVKLPSGLTLVSTDAPGDAWAQSTKVWTVPALAVGASAQVNVKVKADALGEMTARATVVKSKRFDPATGNNGAATTFHVPQADLSLHATGPGIQVDAGADAPVHFEISNHGPDRATGVSVQLRPPGGASISSGSSSSGTFDPGSGLWAPGPIASGASETLDVNVTSANVGAFSLGGAIAASDQADSDASDDSAFANLGFGVPPAPPATSTPPSGPAAGDTPSLAPAAAPKASSIARDLISTPAKTLGAAAAGMALVAAGGAAAGAAGAAGASGAGGSGSGGSQGGERRDAHHGKKIEFGASSGGGEGISRGDLSPTWRLPGHGLIDAASMAVPLAFARKSPLVTGMAVDGAYLRAMFGSLWALGIAPALAVGIFAAASVHGEATIPTTAWFLLALVIGIIDASWGVAVVFAFVVSILAWGGINSFGQMRLLVATAVLWVSVPVIVGHIRHYRRKLDGGKLDLHMKWVRAGDFVIAPLVAYWLAGALATLIPHISGEELPWIHAHIEEIRLAAAAAMFTRVALEASAAQWYPRRMSITNPDALPEQAVGLGLASMVVRSGLFFLITRMFMGTCWQLWVALALYVCIETLPVIRHKFPNLVRLYPLVPGELVKVIIVVLGAKIILEQLSGRIGDPEEILRWGLMLSLVPLLCVKASQAISRNGDRPVNWGTRMVGVGFVALFASLALAPH
ncbi:MAG: DUF11 domain-containing protein [Solirubrobacterales bacterium]|nr:DUF11 domain-containing protein [Solirubrobacterales bacterium]